MLERFLLNELEQTDRDMINENLKNDPVLRKRLEELKLSNEEILFKYRPAAISQKIMEKFQGKYQAPVQKMEKIRSRKPLKFNIALAISSFATIIMVVFILGPGYFKQTETVSEITRFKGDSLKLYIYKKQHNNVIKLVENDRVFEGDVLQISYFVTGAGAAVENYGMIFSLDGRGEVTLHFPQTGQNAQKLFPNKKVYLENSYQLDDAPGFEQFFLVTSEKLFNIKNILDTVEIQKPALISGEKSALILDQSFQIQSFRLRK